MSEVDILAEKLGVPKHQIFANFTYSELRNWMEMCWPGSTFAETHQSKYTWPSLEERVENGDDHE